jgi:predicted HTH transcriptional regulator
MFESAKELLDKIRLGEDSFLELKEVRFAGSKVADPSRDGLGDELAAFGNGPGGVCVLGVEDKTREVLGIPLERLDLVETYVREICNDSISPPLTVYVERLLLPSTPGAEVPVVRVDVPRSLFVHQSPGGYFYRLGSSKRAMRPDYLARLFQQRSQTRLIRFDEQVVASATLEALKPELYERFTTRRTNDAPEHFLSKLGMAREDEDGTWRPSVAGILMATGDPRAWLPNAFVQAVAYAGTSSVPEEAAAYQIDAKDITGPLDEQVIEACRFVWRNSQVAARKDVGRIDLPAFDMTAVFEAVVNAVAHRDYSIYGSKVRLQLYRDRLVLYSPGGLPNTITVESMRYRQAVRNEAVTSLLARCPVPDVDWLSTDRRFLMDRRGEGVPVIVDRSEALSGRTPVYRLLDESELELTIFAAQDGEKSRKEDDRP